MFLFFKKYVYFFIHLRKWVCLFQNQQSLQRFSPEFFYAERQSALSLTEETWIDVYGYVAHVLKLDGSIPAINKSEGVTH